MAIGVLVAVSLCRTETPGGASSDSCAFTAETPAAIRATASKANGKTAIVRWMFRMRGCLGDGESDAQEG